MHIKTNTYKNCGREWKQRGSGEERQGSIIGQRLGNRVNVALRHELYKDVDCFKRYKGEKLVEKELVKMTETIQEAKVSKRINLE